LKDVPDDRVRVYVIWDPIYGGRFDSESTKLSRSFPDKRVSYYKDPDSIAGKLWERVLKTEREIAWDVYFLFDPNTNWEDEPPAPSFWMHQLFGVTRAPFFNVEKFTAELRGQLDRLGPAGADKQKR